MGAERGRNFTLLEGKGYEVKENKMLNQAMMN